MIRISIINILFPGLMLFIIALPGLSQQYEVRTIEDEYGYIAVQLRDTVPVGLPAVTSDITDFQFELRWPQAYGSEVDVELICSDYYLTDGLGSVQGTGSYFWRVFAADSIPFHPSHNWAVKQWETIGLFKVLNDTGPDTGFFAVAANDWVVQGLNLGLDGEDFSVEVNDSVVNYAYPTIVWDWVWQGGATPSSGYDENSWTFGNNWSNECGDIYSPGLKPDLSSYCIIPGNLTYYPTNFNNYSSGHCKNLKMLNGAHLEIPEGKMLFVTGQAETQNESQIIIHDGGSLNVESPD